jgi:hypothetical protein
MGSRLGWLAGFVWLSSAAVLRAEVNAWLAALICLAMGWFAASQVPGRLPMRTGRVIGWVFFATVGWLFLLFGPVAALCVLITCLVFVLISQNTRAVRFFVDPLGLAILASSVVGRWLIGRPMWDGHEAWFDVAVAYGRWEPSVGAVPATWAALAVGMLPWLQLALVAVAMGLCQGHYATPFWRFLGCWILVGAGWIALGATDGAAALALIMPPMCVLAAAGLARIAVLVKLALNRKNKPGRVCP